MMSILNENQCHFCGKPMGKETGRAECMLTKEGQPTKIILLERCENCYSPKMPVYQKVIRWIILIIAIVIIFTLANAAPYLFGWNLSLLPNMVAGFLSIFLKGLILVLTYVFLSRLLKLSRPDSRSKAGQLSEIKELIDQGYVLTDVTQKNS